MNACVLGAGLWARGHVSFEAFAKGVEAQPALTAAAPRPARIAARELRRLPDPARLAVEVADQACAAAGVREDEVVPVFSSTLGDSAITDYMCRTLAGEDKLLSPLRFQNSVHNSPAGALSIATGNRCATSFVAAFENSLALALLEALVLLQSQPLPVLLVTTDVPVPEPLADVHGPGDMAAAALLLGQPGDTSQAFPNGLATLRARVDALPGAATAAANVPATHQAWPLLQALCEPALSRIDYAIGLGSALRLELSSMQGGAA